jgi:hypothetical protein
VLPTEVPVVTAADAAKLVPLLPSTNSECDETILAVGI